MPDQQPNLPQNIKPPVPTSWKNEALPHKFCPGCGNGDILKLLGQILDEQSAQTSENIKLYHDTSCFVMADIFTIPAQKVLFNADFSNLFDKNKLNIFLIGEEGAKYPYYRSIIDRIMEQNLPVFIIITKNGIGGGFYVSHPNVPKQPNPAFSAPEPYTPAIDMHSVIDRITISDTGYIGRGSIARLGQLKSSIRKGLDSIQTGKSALLEILSVCPYLSMLDAKSSIKLMDEQLLMYEVRDYTG